MIGLSKETRRLKTAVAVRVAATDTVAVLTAVTRISSLGTGNSFSMKGMFTSFTSGALGVFGLGLFGCFPSSGLPLIPGGGLRSAGGTTSGL